jgi:hypothetical protein
MPRTIIGNCTPLYFGFPEDGVMALEHVRILYHELFLVVLCAFVGYYNYLNIKFAWRLETNKEICFMINNSSIFEIDLKFYFISIQDGHGLSNATSRSLTDLLSRSDPQY